MSVMLNHHSALDARNGTLSHIEGRWPGPSESER
jgi:hypothetical protein